jgi:drug/metabolite transporter superfamily protein YnfA
MNVSAGTSASELTARSAPGARGTAILILWGVIFDGFHPDRYDIAGAVICLFGVALIMYAPR